MEAFLLIAGPLVGLVWFGKTSLDRWIDRLQERQIERQRKDRHGW